MAFGTQKAYSPLKQLRQKGDSKYMAQSMMHLLIADKIYTEESGFIHSYGEFLLGSIAPDAVHAKENYTREVKDISHYRFNSKSPISHFDPFFDEYSTLENKDFVLGYLVHLLSDMIWYHSIRVPFKERFLQAPSHDMSMNEAYYADCKQMEELLLWEENARRIINGITESSAYSLEGLIDAESVRAWKERLIFDYNNKRDIPPHTKYISEQHIRDYIADCSKECRQYLDAHHMFQG